jgi:hypothetical protein
MDEARFVDAALRNPVNRTILERLPALGLTDAWLVIKAASWKQRWPEITVLPAFDTSAVR